MVGQRGGAIRLADVVSHVRPTMLIGTSTQAGAFTEGIVRQMARYAERPIIMPLSNPTSKCEALPEDLLRWTDGRALIATGSPFPPVTFGETTYRIAQANNALIFPGLGLGVIVAKARRITDPMIAAAANASPTSPTPPGWARRCCLRSTTCAPSPPRSGSPSPSLRTGKASRRSRWTTRSSRCTKP